MDDPRILLVDDSEDVTSSLAKLLRLHTKCEVQTCCVSSECVKTAINFQPHLILLDIGMPHPNGFEIGQELRQLGMPCKLLAISGYPDEKIRSRCAEIGFDGFLRKPICLKEIRQIIESIRQQNLIDQLAQ